MNSNNEMNKFYRKRVLIFAVTGFLIIISGLIFMLDQKPEIIVREAILEIVKDTLPDGSILSLNKNSKISYPEKFSAKTREMDMNGEVFFEIKADKSRPFIIHAGNTLVRVYGSSFNLKTIENGSDIELFVKSGSVEFSAIEKYAADTLSIVLEAGQKGIYSKNTKKISKIVHADQNELFWKERKLVFNQLELVKLKMCLEKNYGVQLNLKGENLEDLKFSATFKNQPIGAVMNVIAYTLGLKITKNGDSYDLERPEN